MSDQSSTDPPPDDAGRARDADTHDDDVYDAVIVGARVAGASTAMLLARLGWRVLLVDRSREGADTLSTHALMRTGVLQLHRWGLLDRVIAAGTPPIRRTVFHYGEDSVRVTIKPAHGVDALYAPRRTVIDPILVEAAREAGAEVRFGVTVTAVDRDRSGRVSGVTLRDTTGAAKSVRAHWTVGADGLHSFVANAVDAPVIRQAGPSSSTLYAYVGRVEAAGYEWFYRTGASAGFIPTNSGHTCVFVATPHGGLEIPTVDRWAVMLDRLDRVSPDAAARARAGDGPVGMRGFAGLRGYVKQSWGPGWALVGDAGYFKDPLTAHGISDALRDAELLARALVASRRDPEQEGAALSEYQAVRDRLSARLFATTEQIASFTWKTSDVPDLLLELSSSMTDEVEHLVSLDRLPAMV